VTCLASGRDSRPAVALDKRTPALPLAPGVKVRKSLSVPPFGGTNGGDMNRCESGTDSIV